MAEELALLKIPVSYTAKADSPVVKVLRIKIEDLLEHVPRPDLRRIEEKLWTKL